MTDNPRPVDRDDPLFAPFWEGTEAGELRVQRCAECGALRWPPRPMCARCHSMRTDWVAVEPRGTLFSWVGVEHQTVRGVQPPYMVGLVEPPAAGIRMLGRLAGVDPPAVSIGLPLKVRFEPSAAGVTLANWAPAEAGDGEPTS